MPIYVETNATDYETVAASQTAQTIGSTGSAGDYLSHIIIQPATVGAGTVIVYDNTVAVYTFTTGTLSDLRPIPIPIGAKSVNGPWKITTGANETVLAVGKFS